MADNKEPAVPEPNPNQRRPAPAGESPLQAAPPVPGAAPVPPHPERRLGPAPAVPVGGGWAAAPTGERPLAPAPLPQGSVASAGRATSGGGERPLTAAPAPVIRGGPVPVGREDLAHTRSVGGERPMAGVGGAPSAGYAPVAGALPQAANPVSAPAALYGSVAPAGTMPAGVAGQPFAPGQPSQPTPPAGPAWHQPPAAPPPVPPPSVGSVPPEPPAPRPVAWSPHARTGPVGAAVTSAIDGHVKLPVSKTSSAKSLRREVRARSSMLAITFLFVAATFLIGMLVILLLTLAS